MNVVLIMEDVNNNVQTLLVATLVHVILVTHLTAMEKLVLVC